MAIYEKLPHLNAIAFPSRCQYGALNFVVRIDRFWERWGASRFVALTPPFFLEHSMI